MLTKVWLEAGFKSEQVDMAKHKLVFRRVRQPHAADAAGSGFALLLVYAMAAAVAIMLYMQLPRVAFEAQREKEQLLIDRGQQYSRAVQLYVRKYQRFPTDIAALENTQNIRFLRKQYTDPMTSKNEWRIIHVGPGGVFTDSQVFSNQVKKEKEIAACSAALAAAFNTPIAAVLFSLEEILGDLHAPVLGAVVISSATSWMCLHLILGDEPLFHVPAYHLVNPRGVRHLCHPRRDWRTGFGRAS